MLDALPIAQSTVLKHGRGKSDRQRDTETERVCWSRLRLAVPCVAGIREYMCRLCNYKGVTQSDLNRHTKSQIHLMKARNECVQCSEGFVSPMNLEQHRQDKHPTSNSPAVHVPVVTMNAEVI